MNLQGFLSACGAKPSSKPHEWLMNCWMCNGINKFYFNTHKLVGFCQKCQRPGSLRDLAGEVGGITVKDIQQFVEESEYQDKMSQGFRESVMDSLLDEGSARAIAPREISLPPTHRTLKDGQASVIGRKALAYLEHRGFDSTTLFNLHFGFCSGGYYGNRIIIPFWEGGRIVYWQARDFTGNVPVAEKILNPPSSTTSIGKSSVLYNYDEARHHDCVVICESWGSAMATGRAAVGLNGNNMSNVQMQKLLGIPCSRFMVLLDHGMEHKAWDIAHRLAPYRETSIATLPFGDPNEVDRSVLFQAIMSAEPYTQMSHLKYTVEHM